MNISKIIKKLFRKVKIKPSEELHETVTPEYQRKAWQEKTVEQIREDHKLNCDEKLS